MQVRARRATAVASALALVVVLVVLAAVLGMRGPATGSDAGEPRDVRLRVSTSSAGFVDSDGQRWSADQGFVGGTRVDAPEGQQVRGTSEPALYASQRWGMSAFRAPLPDGRYDVTLHLADTWFDAAGQRVFDVLAEGEPAAEGVDIVAEVGPDTAWDLTFPVEVADGSLDLEFVAGVDHPTVGAVSAALAAPRRAAAPSQPPLEDSTAWLSGASGEGVDDGSYAAWRGSPVEVVGTWADAEHSTVELLQLQPDGQYGEWDGHLDIALGALVEGETWAGAAQGQADARWRASLTELARLREGSTGTTYIRFAHEMNGNWYAWAAGPPEAPVFQTAWKRFRALQRELFPDAQLVFSVNRESVVQDLDWRTLFPGAEHVDVMSVDYYNQFPYVETPEQWAASLTEVDRQGAPKGLEAHRRFAERVGLPLAVSEWSGNASEGDSPAFIAGMHGFFSEHAGSGPGQVLYEVQMNEQVDGRQWALYPASDMPRSTETYQDLW